MRIRSPIGVHPSYCWATMVATFARFESARGLLDALALPLFARSASSSASGRQRGASETGRAAKGSGTPDDRDRDSELLQSVARGDERALATLYDRYSSFSFALLFRMLGDRDEAEDALQEVFLKVWRSADRFDPKIGTVSTWLSILTRNHAVDRLRSGRRATRRAQSSLGGPSGSLEPADPKLEPAAQTAIDEDAAFVRRCLNELPREQLIPIELAYFDHLSQSEIAETLQQPLGTVKTRMRSGLQKLRKSLGPRFGVPE
ncbi:MAG: sigma-70 family RNA polymerase sigma factor [Planctomycetes bacterium]|nr:sigma-70 family RNA polymerase sigma factor [Planctomycetota bacterium]MBI3847830.1 sigma-70 family RNA polymerase sigma factor [Planctomycetota bacterium]